MSVDPAWLLRATWPSEVYKGQDQFPADPCEAGAPAWSVDQGSPLGSSCGSSQRFCPDPAKEGQAPGFCPQREMDEGKFHKPQGRGSSGWWSWEDSSHAPDVSIAPCHPEKPNLQGHTQPRHTPHLMPTELRAAILISGLSPEGGVGKAGSRKQGPQPVFPERC